MGKPSSAAALVALHHRAGEEPVIAEQLGGAGSVALTQQRADAGGRDVVVAFVEHVEDFDIEAVALAGILEESRGALALVAEVEIGADFDALHVRAHRRGSG